METAIMSAMCRCCASEGVFKDVKSSYTWMGDEEVYADMLRECFDIHLSTSEHCEDGGICEVCITQLRNASNFKKQVLHTEEQFKKHINNKLFKPSIVKVEVSAEEDNDSDDNNMSAEEAYSGPEFEIPIKTETEEPKPKKRAASSKATTSRAKKAKGDSGESSSKHLRARTKEHCGTSPIICLEEEEEEEEEAVDEDEGKELKLDKKKNFSSFISIRPVGKMAIPWVRDQQKRLAQQKRLSELDWQFDNIKTILKCSNATPVRCRVGTRFACSYCLNQFQNPVELKVHTDACHRNDKPEFFNARSLSRHIVYLDITNLRCTICKDNMKGLEEIMDHLKTVHKEVIHKQIKNQIVPFKYEGRKILCGVCALNIGEYLDLQDHMSDHYKNYICEFCDLAFVIRSKMLEHKKTVHLV